ncbi:MAG: hypothetical protein EWM48_10940, partial [Sphaerochaeta sp.]
MAAKNSRLKRFNVERISSLCFCSSSWSRSKWAMRRSRRAYTSVCWTGLTRYSATPMRIAAWAKSKVG